MSHETLHITNGSCAVAVMRKAGVQGEIISWDDVLHCGPVPGGLNLEELSEVRAQYIADQGWAPLNKVRDKFFQRDRTLNHFREFSKIILWFEHDLYDQLQLLQLLDWFERHKEKGSNVSLICVNQFLGPMSPEQLKKLIGTEKPVTGEQFHLAQMAWKAFCAPQPDSWLQLLSKDTSALPFLHASILRLLQEYPFIENGLSRTEQTALNAVASGSKSPAQIFEYVQDQEQARFMGDVVFWTILRQFCRCDPPLLSMDGVNESEFSFHSKTQLSLTDAGKSVLIGEANWLALHPFDRWLGGVHLHAEQYWCWNLNAMSVRQFRRRRP